MARRRGAHARRPQLPPYWAGGGGAGAEEGGAAAFSSRGRTSSSEPRHRLGRGRRPTSRFHPRAGARAQREGMISPPRPRLHRLQKVWLEVRRWRRRRRLRIQRSRVSWRQLSKSASGAVRWEWCLRRRRRRLHRCRHRDKLHLPSQVRRRRSRRSRQGLQGRPQRLRRNRSGLFSINPPKQVHPSRSIEASRRLRWRPLVLPRRCRTNSAERAQAMET